ncbi:MAG: tandem-95 repeat protein, partial [Candidatus Marinimicrobia bacterium]|nr:tandem-95 repeat protein [Candidatus Neomarinimicrobiota bacterium]
NWQATSVSGTAKNSSNETATITMDGTHPWGDPKLVFTVDGTAIADTRAVIGGKDTSNANDPVATADSETINENQVVIIDVLANDTDADGDTLSIKSIGDASYGQVSLAQGSVIYTPNYGYSSDVEVSAGSFVTDTEYTIASAGTTDYTSIGASANTVGTVFTATGVGSGTGKATEIVPDEFTYTVTDGKGGTNQGTVSITVTGVNQAPVAVDDIYTFKQGSGSVVLDVLANDTDAEDDDLSIISIVPNIPTATPNGGMFSLFGGVISYALPSDSFYGVETVTYLVSDGSKDANNIPIYDTGVATITIEALNNAPVAVADTMTLAEDVDSVLVDVLGNDTDADSDTLTIDSFTNPSSGTARLMGGALFYTPDENFSGSDSFTYTVADSLGASDTETVTLTVTSENDAPVTITDVLNIEEGSTDGITVNLLSNDYDRESDAFTLTSITAASHGTAVKNDDGTVTYTPGKKEDGSNYTGSDEFTYMVTDVNGAKATGTVSLTVSVINGAPVTTADVSTVAEDSSSNRISVLTNDTDPEDNTLTLDSVTAASHGTVTVAGNVALYSPDANFTGSDSFSYWVTDGEGGSTKGAVSVTVTASNDAPTAVNDTLGSISASRPSTLDLMANDTDPDGDTLTISAVEGDVTVSAGSFATGTKYTIASVGDTDYTSIGASANTVGTEFTATGEGSGTGTGTWDGDATYGNVTISGTSVRFNATRGSAGESDSFSYTITDADGETSTAIANFTISSNTNPNAINDKVTY